RFARARRQDSDSASSATARSIRPKEQSGAWPGILLLGTSACPPRERVAVGRTGSAYIVLARADVCGKEAHGRSVQAAERVRTDAGTAAEGRLADLQGAAVVPGI